MVYVAGTFTLALMITQLAFLLQNTTGELVVAGAFLGIGVPILASISCYGMLYYPVKTEINVDKSTDQIEVTYKMMCFGREMKMIEALHSVELIEVQPVKSQYGIVGYVANIAFNDGAESIQIYRDGRGGDVVADFEELSMFILGRNAKNNELRSNCDCSCGASYCICCKNWFLILVLFVLVSLIYIGGSFGIAYSQDDAGLLFTQNSTQI